MSNLDAKREAVEAFFDRWNSDLDKAEDLILMERFYLEGWLVISCHIGALASMRYPNKPDGEAFVAIILEYSGDQTFWSQIDLLFLYQWPRSKLREHGTYKSLAKYAEVAEAIQSNYGTEDHLTFAMRFVDSAKLIATVLAASINDLDENKFRNWLPLFSLAEQLYRYVRCDAVHNLDFPFINEVHTQSGAIRYEHNHLINGDLLVKTARSILGSLREHCTTESKWPHEL